MPSSKHLRVLGAAVSALTLAPAAAFAQVQLPFSEVDLGIAFHEGELELHWHIHDEATEIEYEPADAYAFTPLSSSILRPAGAAWDFIGTAAGNTVYIFPETEQPGTVYLGLASEEIVAGTFVDNTLTFALTGITGPGAFALWQTDGFGSPTAFLGSSAGPASFDLITGNHDHFNWGFTAPGVYELTFTASGILNDGNNTLVSDSGTFTFAVGTPIPEPSAFAALAGLAGLALAATKRRRRA